MKKWIIGFLLLCSMVFAIKPMEVRAAEYPDFQVVDTLKWTLTTMDGKTINETTYTKEFRIYMFVSCHCTNSPGAVMSIANSSWINNEDIKVLVIFDDIFASYKDKQDFISNYAPNNKNIIFAYGTDSFKMIDYYMNSTLKPDTLTYAMPVVIDSNNIIRRAATKLTSKTADDFFESAINKYLYVVEENDFIEFDIDGTFDYDEAKVVFTELNVLRKKLGLSALTWDKDLTDSAMQRAAEIAIYFSHTRPNGQKPFTVFPPNSLVKSENIAAGFPDAKSVMDGWTNSPGHYSNMVAKNVESVGVGCFYQPDGKIHWVQLFDGGRKPIKEDRVGTKDTTVEISAIGANIDINIRSSQPYVGIKDTVKYELYNSNKEYKDYIVINPKKYSTSDKTIATVNSKGVVTGVKEGSAWIDLGLDDKNYWRANVNVLGVFKITYNVNGGKGAPASQTKLFDKPVQLSTVKPTKEGHTFLGWSTDSKAKTVTYKAGATIPENINNDIKLYAVWQAGYCYISFNLQGGKGNINIQVVKYDVATKLIKTVPTKTGYKFLGWATTKDAKTAQYKPGDKISVTKTQFTLYAVWKKA